ncbi:MAG: glycosyltransferase [Candidatus Aminicenantes bacterium]|nr:glycosyltransferase [Candidatus Aminicenantes bacterium]
MWGLEEIELKKSPFYRFVHEKDMDFFFVNDLGKRILTDKVGQSVWEALPGSGDEICEKVRETHLISKRLVYEFLYVFCCAGIIESKKLFEPKQSPESVKEFSEPKNRDLVSVIIVTHNGRDFISTCLKSIFWQSYQNLEVMCVDNHSTDETVSFIKDHFPKVHITALKKNRHYAQGINKGLQRARGRYVLVLNQDTELDPDCVQLLVKKAQSVPEAGAVVPMMKFARLRDFINGIGNQVNNHSWGTDNFIYCVDIGQFQELKEVPSACFGAVLLKRDAVEEVGFVDSGYGSFYEDVDWSFRCWFQGWKVVPEPQAVVYHEFGGSYPEGIKLFFAVRNRLRLVLKLFCGRVKLGFLKNYILEDIRCVLSFVKSRQGRKIWIYVRAYLSLLCHLPGIAVKRWNVMRTKAKGMREKTILQKNPSFYCCLNASLEMPEIDTPVIRRYYRRHLLNKERDKGQIKETCT